MSEHRDTGSYGDLHADERRALEVLSFETPSGGASRHPKPGVRYGDFEVEREIGRGGMGVVYRAIQYPLGRAVALKVIAEPPAPATEDRSRAERLDREARLLASLRHEGIVTVHAAGSAPGFRYVAMDLVEGTTLREILSGRAAEWPAPGEPGRLRLALELLHRVASALAAAHARGIVHRDVKPENVLVDQEGRPVLADFGLARDIGPESAASVTRGFVGTPRYASPEQVRGEALSPASDVFSFGLTAYELLTGRPAFGGANESQIRDAIEWRDPIWPRRLRFPTDVRAVVDRCLEKRVEDRYSDAGAVESDLALLLKFEPVSAVTRGPVARLFRRMARRPSRAAAAFAVAAVVVGAIVSGALIGRGGSEEVRRAESRARFEQALRILESGDVVRADALLADLVADGDPPRGARSRLADRRLRNGESVAALELYSAEVAAFPESPTAADRLGAHASEAIANGTPLSPPGSFGELVTARDHALAAFVEERRGERDAALDLLDRAVTMDPSAFEWRLYRASLLARSRRYARSAADFRLVASRSSLARPHVWEFADVLFLLARFEESEFFVRAAVESSTEDPSLLSLHARLLLQLGRIDDAELVLERAERLDESHPVVITTKCRLVTAQGDRARARRMLTDAVDARPHEPVFLFELARLELGDERFEEALEVATRMPQDETWEIERLSLRTKALEKLKRFDEAAKAYPVLRRRDPENPGWAIQHGHMLRFAGRMEEAETAFREAIAIDPRQAAPLNGLGQVLARTGRFDEAIEVTERALGLDPTNKQTYYWLADLWVDRGSPETALAHLDRALERHPAWFDAWALKGVASTEAGDFEAAAAAFEEALAIHPGHAPVRADLADILHRLGRDREALVEYRRAREADPDLPTAWCGEGLLLLDSHDLSIRDRKKAVEFLERAVELRPDFAPYAEYLEDARYRK